MFQRGQSSGLERGRGYFAGAGGGKGSRGFFRLAGHLGQCEGVRNVLIVIRHQGERAFRARLCVLSGR